MLNKFLCMKTDTSRLTRNADVYNIVGVLLFKEEINNQSEKLYNRFSVSNFS